VLSAAAGSHRFVWDLHYPPPPGPRHYPMTAVPHDTPSTPLGPWVPPGRYTVRLTVGGRAYEQPLTVKMDPRVKTPAEGLAQQFELSMQCYNGARQAREALAQVRSLRAQLKELQGKAKEQPLLDALAELDKKAAALEGAERRRGERPPDGPREPTLARLAEEQQRLLDILQGADATPTTQVVTACEETRKPLSELLRRWDELKTTEVKALNEQLRKVELPPLTVP
jgi:hypothetical protein